MHSRIYMSFKIALTGIKQKNDTPLNGPCFMSHSKLN